MKKFTKILMVLSTVYLFSIIVSNAQQPSLLPAEQLNPAYIKYLNDLKVGKINTVTSDGHGLGAIPSRLKPNFDEYFKNHRITKGNFASVYDMRTNGLLTSIKNQGGCGCCWSFATCAVIESYLLKFGYGTWDFSEENLKNCFFPVSHPCPGANVPGATGYLVRRLGPIVASDEPYNMPAAYSDSACIDNLNPQIYVSDMRQLPNDVNTVKQALLDWGAVGINFFWDPENYYNDPANNSNSNPAYDKYTYYAKDNNCYTSNDCGGHSVTIAGWNDTIKTAGGTGAWIIKNSWGTGFGEKGFFYMSYKDKTIDEFAYFPRKIDYNGDSKVYSYSYIGSNNSFGWKSSTGYALVKYTATDNNPITKIGSWIGNSGTVNIKIYGSFDGTKLSNLLGSLTGQTCDFAGYYTFDLSSSIPVTNGKDFYIEMEYSEPGQTYVIPVEDDYDYNNKEFLPNTVVQTGACWVSSDGSSWQAIGNNTSNKINLCVNAYTTGCPDLYTGTAIVSPNPVDSSSNVTLTLKGYNGSIQWQSASTVTFNDSQGNDNDPIYIEKNYKNISGATNNTYVTVGGITKTSFFRAQVTNGSCRSLSNRVEVTMVSTAGINQLISNNKQLTIYPNPANQSSVISYLLSENSLVKINIYDLTGRKIADIVNENQGRGEHSIKISTQQFENGIYILKFNANNFTTTKKIIIQH